MSIFKIFPAFLAVLALAACTSGPPPKDYSLFRQNKPRSIVVVPVINKSSEVDAADLFLATISVPLANRGYYVFPTIMVKTLMEREGLGDPNLIHTTDSRKIASLFNADAVLYVEVLKWKARYIVVSSGIEVGFLYTLKDGKTGALLWQDETDFYYEKSSGVNPISLTANAISAAVDNARSDYTPQAVAVNSLAIFLPGQGLPSGPYDPRYEKDLSEFPASGKGNFSNAKTKAVALP